MAKKRMKTGWVICETTVDVRSAADMLEACLEVFDDCEAAILVAAVADYRPAEFSPETIAKEDADRHACDRARVIRHLLRINWIHAGAGHHLLSDPHQGDPSACMEP